MAPSAALEAAQALFTTARTVQLPDLLGNVVGVLAGTCLVAVFVVAWRMTHPLTASDGSRLR